MIGDLLIVRSLFAGFRRLVERKNEMPNRRVVGLGGCVRTDITKLFEKSQSLVNAGQIGGSGLQ